jgi:hypothetical protein
VAIAATAKELAVANLKRAAPTRAAFFIQKPLHFIDHIRTFQYLKMLCYQYGALLTFTTLPFFAQSHSAVYIYGFIY